MASDSVSAGRLLVVATPIGNLEDLSPRAANSLRQADRILAEDTRRTRRLLSHLGIEGKPLARLDAEIESRGVTSFVQAMQDGAVIALVSDAGTPVISDPGASLIEAAAAAGVAVTPIPGPSAVTAALAASGFAGERFRFMGFLPRSGARRRQVIAELVDTPETTVLFEAPTRIADTLKDLAKAMPDRPAMVARELSKIHEELIRGTLAELRRKDRQWRGEITLVLGPGSERKTKYDAAAIDQRIDQFLGDGLRAKDVSKALALESGWSASDIYARISVRKKKR